VRLIAVAVVLSGCFQPGAPADVPCGPGGACPPGQSCVGDVCRLPGFVGEDAAVDAAIDAADLTCPGGDDKCTVDCVTEDPDCQTTCGDGRCVGNAGEMCGICASDCNVASACGNGHCEMGESPDCFADCGPSPWTFAADETALFDMVNAARTGGTMCPGTTMPTTAPALARHDPFLAGIREWAWEIAHQNVFITGGNSCNGRNAVTRVGANFGSFIQSRNHADVQAAFTSWITTANLCTVIMNPTRTKANVAFANDVTRGFVIVLAD
jgi:hypothetical protein